MHIANRIHMHHQGNEIHNAYHYSAQRIQMDPPGNGCVAKSDKRQERQRPCFPIETNTFNNQKSGNIGNPHEHTGDALCPMRGDAPHKQSDTQKPKKRGEQRKK